MKVDWPWRAAAKYWKSEDAYLILADRDGTIRWQLEVDATDASYASLEKKLNRLLTATALH
jgi:predicted lipoprotein with Yx(FWY)xxD motif